MGTRLTTSRRSPLPGTELPHNDEPTADTIRDFGLESNLPANQPNEKGYGSDLNYGARERSKVVAGVTDKVMTAGGKLAELTRCSG